LSATVQTIASWSGTFSAQYTGSQCGVAGCVSHTIPVTGALSPTGVAPGAPSLAWLDIGPNPFGESTTVRVRVVGGQFARLVVHDIAGHTVATLIDGRWLEGGEHEYRWNRRSRGGRRVPAGVYFVRLQTGSTSRVAKLVVLN